MHVKCPECSQRWQTSQRWRDALKSVVLPLEVQHALLQYRRSTSSEPSKNVLAVWRLAPSSSHIVAQPLIIRRGAARLHIFPGLHCTSCRRSAPKPTEGSAGAWVDKPGNRQAKNPRTAPPLTSLI